jgi:hypothetical protein
MALRLLVKNVFSDRHLTNKSKANKDLESIRRDLSSNRRHDTQHDDIQHNDIQYKNTILSIMTFSMTVEHCNADCQIQAVNAACHYAKCLYAERRVAI